MTSLLIAQSLLTEQVDPKLVEECAGNVHTQLLTEELRGALESIRQAHDDIHCLESAADEGLVQTRGLIRIELVRVLEPHLMHHKADHSQLHASALGSPLAFRNSAERLMTTEIDKVHARNTQHAQESLETIDTYARARIVGGLDIDEKRRRHTVNSVCDLLQRARGVLHSSCSPSPETLAAASEREFVVARDALEAARHEVLQAGAVTRQGLQSQDLETHHATAQAMHRCLQAHREHHVHHRYSLERVAAHDEAAESLGKLTDSILTHNEQCRGTPKSEVHRSVALTRLEQQLHSWRLGVARDFQAWSADGLSRIEEAYLAALEAMHDQVAREKTRVWAESLAAQGSSSRVGTRVVRLCAQAELPAHEVAALLTSLLE